MFRFILSFSFIRHKAQATQCVSSTSWIEPSKSLLSLVLIPLFSQDKYKDTETTEHQEIEEDKEREEEEEATHRASRGSREQ